MKKILIVDDIDTNRKLIKKMVDMLKIGISVEAVDGQDAINKFETENPDLILMDINMPVMDGFQSAASIKALSGSNYVPVIFVTALSSESSLGYALAAGGDDFISKPINIEILESKIKAHLRIRKLNQQLNIQNKQLSHEQELIEYFFESALNKSYLNEDVIKYHMSSMSTFNGDLLLVKRSPNGGMYVLMGDFTGHGLTAAMGTLPVAMIFFKMAEKGINVSDIAAELNHQLNELMPTGMFFAASIIEINARCDVMTVWMGGVPETYLLGKLGGLKASIKSKHMPLGILKKDQFNSEVDIYNIEKGDKAYLYSDGIIEAQNTKGDMFGNARLKKIIENNKVNRFDKILSELEMFVSTGNQTDDITLLEITCNELPPEEFINNNNTEAVYELPWQTGVSLCVEDIRSDDPINAIVDMLGAIPMLSKHKGSLNILLSEMYSNSLEHSVLSLNSSWKTDADKFADYYAQRESQLNELKDVFINFKFIYKPASLKRKLRIEISDSGTGYVPNSSASETDLHGRGMAIIESLCEEYSFSDDGKFMQVIFAL